MINRIFFITENMNTSGGMQPSEENVYYSILVDPLEKGSLENAYVLLGQTTMPQISLTIEIRQSLPEDSFRFITSFLFFPAYLRIRDLPVINLSGSDPELLRESASRLSAYFSSQGIQSSSINRLLHAGKGENPEDNRVFLNKEELIQYYKGILQSDHSYNRNVFFFAPSLEDYQSAFNSMQQTEKNFKEHDPALYSLIGENNSLEKELQSLRRLYACTAIELKNQQQYVEVLRSGHATKEIQDYYTNEYEILPLWYKRFGHILKVLTGKRAFKSLYRDDVKKYKG
jgi:hypothetical protein